MKKLITALLTFSFLAHAVDLHYFMNVGQSLMLGSNGGSGLSTSQVGGNVYVDSGGFHALTASTLESPMYGAANQFRSMAGAGYDVVAYNAGVGSALYNDLKLGTTPFTDSITNAALMPSKSVAAGKTYEFSAILCVHGESDAKPTLGPEYYQDLLNWQRDYSAALKAISSQTTNIPFFTDQTFPWTINGGIAGRANPVDANGNFGPNQAQWLVARNNPSLFYIFAPVYPYTYVDSLHLVNTAYQIFGETAGKWMYRVLVLGNPWAGLVPRSITRSGAVITARYWTYGGASLVIDTSTVSDKGNGKGFEYTDDSGNPPSISSVSVLGDTATITLASTPSGGNQRLRYAFTGTVGATGGQSGQAHGNIRNDDATVGVGSGAALRDWSVMFDAPIPSVFTPTAPVSKWIL